MALYNYGNCTQWNAIWYEIKQRIIKSQDSEVRGRVLTTSSIQATLCDTKCKWLTCI